MYMYTFIKEVIHLRAFICIYTFDEQRLHNVFMELQIANPGILPLLI